MHVTIAIPAYTGQIYMGTMRSLLNDIVKLIDRGDTFTLIDNIGSAYIADCRGAIATNFYYSDYKFGICTKPIKKILFLFS